jgi:hypothetical protein
VFCSRPCFWQNDAPADFQRTIAYDIEPSRLASAVGITAQSIQSYLVDVDALTDLNAKAHADDQFALGDFWVFTDFWRRLGIVYPTPPQGLTKVLRLGAKFQKKLPAV